MLATQFRYILFTSLIVILISVNVTFKLPFLEACTIEDEKCHIEQMHKFLEMYSNGIEELNVASMDPLNLGDINIKANSNENFNIQLYMENVDLYNFPIQKCLSIKGFTKDNSKPKRIILKIFSPQLTIKTHCRIKGKLLLFSIAGETDLDIDIKNVTDTMKASCIPYIKDGVVYYKVDELTLNLNISSLSTKFSNSTLFNGEQIFMETFADTINNNWKVLQHEIEPHLSDAFARVAIDILNKLLATMPYDKFFKKSK